MIRTISVRNFKSLKDFRLDLNHNTAPRRFERCGKEHRALGARLSFRLHALREMRRFGSNAEIVGRKNF